MGNRVFKILLQSFAKKWDEPKMMKNFKSLKPTMSVTPAQPKENRCFSKRHFLLVTKQGFSPKLQLNLTTPHGDLENSQALSAFLNWVLQHLRQNESWVVHWRSQRLVASQPSHHCDSNKMHKHCSWLRTTTDILTGNLIGTWLD